MHRSWEARRRGRLMDDTEFRQQQLDLQAEATTEQRRTNQRNFRIGVGTLLLLMLSNFFTMVWSVTSFKDQTAMSGAQFTKTSKDAEYRSIVEGLASSSAAVQTSSMLALVQFVQGASNFDGDRHLQAQQATNAIQTLMAFIEENSVDTSSGLTNYGSPQPIVLSRAMHRLRELMQDPDLGENAADISRANLHGIYLPNFKPNGSLNAVGVDLRRAVLSGMDLTRLKSVNLSFGFLTCADLTRAHFGRTDLQGTDLAGADLSGADLSRVTHLAPGQVVGATTDVQTRLPFPRTTQPGWGQASAKCIQTVDRMSGMLFGQGYIKRLPCPTDRTPKAIAGVPDQFKGRVDDLVTVCRVRAGLGS